MESMDEKELKAAIELRNSLNLRINDLRRSIKAKAEEEAPPPDLEYGDRFTVDVQFTPGSKTYEFLLLRTESGAWYTTGTTDLTMKFNSWRQLVRWLRSDDVYYHGPIVSLLPRYDKAVLPAEQNR